MFPVLARFGPFGIFGHQFGPFTLHTYGMLVALGFLAALVAGGAVGNLIDRLRFGSVVDFIDWHWRTCHWYTFNIADSAISTGAVLLVVHSLFPDSFTAADRPSPPLPGPEA